MAWDKKGLGIAFSSDLAFAEAGVGVNTPSDFPSGDIFIACDFGGNPLFVDEIDSDHLFKVTSVISNPLSDELRLWGGN